MAERPLNRQIAKTAAASNAASIYFRDTVGFSPMASECNRRGASSHGAHACWFAENYCDRMALNARMVRVRGRLVDCEIPRAFAAIPSTRSCGVDCSNLAALQAAASPGRNGEFAAC